MFKEALSVFLLSKLIGKKRTQKLDKFLKKYTRKLASIVFASIAVLHTLRFPLGFDIIIADWRMPLWVSFIIMLLSVYLSYGVYDPNLK